MATSSVRYWWLSKVDKLIYFAFNIGFVSSNCYELHSDNKSQPNAISYPHKQMLFLIHKRLIHKNRSFSYFFKEDKYTQLLRDWHTFKNAYSNSFLFIQHYKKKYLIFNIMTIKSCSSSAPSCHEVLNRVSGSHQETEVS